MLRNLILAVATLGAFAACALEPARAYDLQGSVGGVSAEDRALYADAVRQAAPNAPNDADRAWSLRGRSGVARFAQADADRCRTFFLRQLQPEVRPAVVGKLCPGTTAIVSDMRLAATAGPSGEPRSTVGETRGSSGGDRGIVLPPRRPSPPPAPSTQSQPAPPAAPGTSTTEQPRSAQVNVKPVLVQINRQTRRENQNGGHAVVLLRNTTASRVRNLTTCESLLRHFDDAPISEIRVGVRREADGSISALRPIYWPVDERVTVVGDRCAQRLQRYDFARAVTIRDKLRLAGEGPYLVVTRSDERQAVVIDLSRLSSAEIDKAAIYFRDGFSQRGNVWNPQDFTRQQRERSLIATFGANFPRVLLAAVGFYSAAAANAGAAASSCLGDLSDTRRC
ncbi:MAG: hypothetical protein IV086_11770 [Hyphomonadaceae bacterium]|nr:hypothetical protein [Hyphomonadaceae bacterium]